MNKNIVIFGAGLRGKRLASTIKKYEYGVNLLAFCDNSADKWDNTIDGILIISPQSLQKLPVDTVVIISTKIDTIKDTIRCQLETMGFSDIWEMEDFLALIIYNRVSNFDFSDYDLDNKVNDHFNIGAELSIIVRYHMGEECKLTSCISSIRRCNLIVPYEILLWENEPPSDILGKIIIIVQCTTVINKDSINWLLNLYERYHKKCAVGSLVVNRQFNILNAGYVLGDDFILKAYGHNQNFTDPEYQYVREADALSANNFLFSRIYWCHYMDSYNEWKNDFLTQLDFCLKLRMMGLPLIYQPISMVCDLCESEDFEDKKIENVLFVNKWKKITEDSYTGLEKKEVLCNTLIIEDKVMGFDMHAGGRTLNNYIEIFLEMGMHLIYLPDDLIFDNIYTVRYQQMGILVLYKNRHLGSNNPNDYLKDYLHSIDYAFVNRPNNAEKYLPILRTNKGIIITHFGMDLHYLRLGREAKITQDSNQEKKAEEMKALELDLINKVDFSGYPSYVEVELLKEKYPEANILYFPLYCFDKREIIERSKSNEGILFVGSFGHSPNIDAAIWLVRDIVPLLREYGIKDTVYLAGSEPTDEILELESDQIIVTGYLSDLELQNYYSKCKVAVVPLRYGAGMKGKVLEGMYAGIPMVVTDIGVEGLRDVENVLVIKNTPEEIAAGVWDYYKCEEMLEHHSRLEQQYVMDHFEKNKIQELILFQINKINNDN